MHGDKYTTNDYLMNELTCIDDSTSGHEEKERNRQFTQEEIKSIKHALFTMQIKEVEIKTNLSSVTYSKKNYINGIIQWEQLWDENGIVIYY